MNQRLHFLPFVLSLALLLLPSVGLRAQETFTLVTDASTLSAGDRIVIANTEAGVAMSTKQNKNNRDAVPVNCRRQFIKLRCRSSPWAALPVPDLWHR